MASSAARSTTPSSREITVHASRQRWRMRGVQTTAVSSLRSLRMLLGLAGLLHTNVPCPTHPISAARYDCRPPVAPLHSYFLRNRTVHSLPWAGRVRVPARPSMSDACVGGHALHSSLPHMLSFLPAHHACSVSNAEHLRKEDAAALQSSTCQRFRPSQNLCTS